MISVIHDMVVGLRGSHAAYIRFQAQTCFQIYIVLSTNLVVIAQILDIGQGKGHSNAAVRTKGKRQDCFSGTLLNLWQFIDTHFCVTVKCNRIIRLKK